MSAGVGHTEKMQDQYWYLPMIYALAHRNIVSVLVDAKQCFLSTYIYYTCTYIGDFYIGLYIGCFVEKTATNYVLTVSSLNSPWSSSCTTSRELLSQFSPCSAWRWLEVGGKWKKYIVIFQIVPYKFRSKSPGFQEIKSFFRDAKWCLDASWGFRGLKQLTTFISLVISGSLIYIYNQSLSWTLGFQGDHSHTN